MKRFFSLNDLNYFIFLKKLFSWKASKSGKENGASSSSEPQTSGMLSGSSFQRETKYKVVTDEMKTIYRKQLQPAEDASLFNEFGGSKLDEVAEFDSVPLVLVKKSSSIKV